MGKTIHQKKIEMEPLLKRLEFRIEQVSKDQWRLWITCDKDENLYRPFDAFGDPLFSTEAEAYLAGREWADCKALELSNQ